MPPCCKAIAVLVMGRSRKQDATERDGASLSAFGVDPTVIAHIHALDAQSDTSLEEKVNSGPTPVDLVVATQSSVNDLFHACAAYLTFKLDSTTGVGQATVRARTLAAWVNDLTTMVIRN
ncbi:hypothetical protein B0A53_05480, partial [Rhodotorula sp. CCFEE 5036]